MIGTDARVLGPRDGAAGSLGSIGVRFMVDGDETGGGFSLVEHPDAPAGARGADGPPRARGRVQLRPGGPRRREARRRGRLRRGRRPHLQPRNQWHTFWNAGDTPARILEIIAPAGFERFFQELVAMPAGGPPPTPEQRIAVADRYGLEFDFASIPALLEESGLTFGPPATPAG